MVFRQQGGPEEAIDPDIVEVPYAAEADDNGRVRTQASLFPGNN